MSAPALGPESVAGSAPALRAQTMLDAAASRLTAAADRDATSGFAGVAVSASEDRLTVYWHGAMSSGERQLVSQQQRSGVRVSVVAASYTLRQLRAARDQLVGQTMGPAVAASTSGHVTLVAPRADGTGLDVGMDGAAASSEAAARSAAPALARVPVPVHVVRSAPVSTLRQADTTPYWGGGE